MKLYSVLPIAKGVQTEFLTYYGKDGIELGSLVEIPLRKKVARAIILDSKPLSESKINIKTASFELRRIRDVKNDRFLSQAFFDAAKVLSEHFASPLGPTLFHLLPKILLENIRNLPKKRKEEASLARREKFVLQTDDEERFANYRSIVREEFARGNSLYIALPTIEDVERTYKLLERGIEEYTFTLHSSLGTKEFQKTLRQIKKTDHPKLFIGTIPFLSLCGDKIGTIILERENSRGFRTMSRPFIDLKIFAEEYAKNIGAKFVIGDFLLSLDTYLRFKNDEFSELTLPKGRLSGTARSTIVDMKKPAGIFQKEFSLLSPELESLIRLGKEESSSLFIFAGRKGLAPVTVCGDCGLHLTCANCRTPLVLHRGRVDERTYLCHHCGFERDAYARCANCDSWKLVPLGVGVERVTDEIRKKFPGRKIFELHKDIAKTPKKANEIVSKFENSPGSILVGTEMALLYLGNQIPFTAVASVDSLLSIPDFKMNERVFYILLKIRSLATKEFLIQTRNFGNIIFERAATGNISDFYREELTDRKKYEYPPYLVFIKISLTGKRNVVEREMEKLKNLFPGHEISLFKGLNPGNAERFTLNGLLRIPRSEWPKIEFVKMLQSLPPQFEIQVDPENLL